MKKCYSYFLVQSQMCHIRTIITIIWLNLQLMQHPIGNPL